MRLATPGTVSAHGDKDEPDSLITPRNKPKMKNTFIYLVIDKCYFRNIKFIVPLLNGDII